MDKALEKFLASIQTRSEEVLSITEDPELIPAMKIARVCQLKGMLELSNLLMDMGIQIPAIAIGLIQSEVERVGQ